MPIESYPFLSNLSFLVTQIVTSPWLHKIRCY